MASVLLSSITGGGKNLIFPVNHAVFGDISGKSGASVITDDATKFGGIFNQDNTLLNTNNAEITAIGS